VLLLHLFFLARASLYILGLVFVYFLLVVTCLVVSISAFECLERLVSEVTYDMWNGTVSSAFSHICDFMILFIEFCVHSMRRWLFWCCADLHS